MTRSSRALAYIQQPQPAAAREARVKPSARSLASMYARVRLAALQQRTVRQVAWFSRLRMMRKASGGLRGLEHVRHSCGEAARLQWRWGEAGGEWRDRRRG